MADDDDICDKSFESIVVKDEDILDSSLDSDHGVQAKLSSYDNAPEPVLSGNITDKDNCDESFESVTVKDEDVLESSFESVNG